MWNSLYRSSTGSLACIEPIQGYLTDHHMTIDAAIKKALANPKEGLWMLDSLDAEERLYDYVRLMFHVVEPEEDFIESWALGAQCEHLQAITDGHIRRLLINVPPGFMKSLSCVFWSSWEWGPRAMPHIRTVSASYNDDLTLRDNRRCRSVIQSEEFQARWGGRFALMGDQNEKRKFENDRTGFRQATTIGGIGTGARGHRFVIDDPHSVKTSDSDAIREGALQWFSEVVPSRLIRKSRDAILLIMQRVHERDCSGLAIAKDLGYEHLMLPMEFEPKFVCFTHVPKFGQEPRKMRRVKEESEPLPYWVEDPEGDEVYCWDERIKEGELLNPDFIDAKTLEEQKAEMSAWGGPFAVAGQMQQRPFPRGGGWFKREEFQYINQAPEHGRTVRGWDLAATKEGHGAYTVGLKMMLASDGRLYVLDVLRGRWDPAEVEDQIVAAAEHDGAGCPQSLPQDPGQAGKGQKSYFARQLHGYEFHFSPESGSKEERAKPLVSQCRARNLFLVRAPWNDAFVAEFCAFPGKGAHKDQVDAASRAYMYFNTRQEAAEFAPPVVIMK